MRNKRREETDDFAVVLWLLALTIINLMVHAKVKICVICVASFFCFFFIFPLAISNRHWCFALRPWPNCIIHEI